MHDKRGEGLSNRKGVASEVDEGAQVARYLQKVETIAPARALENTARAQLIWRVCATGLSDCGELLLLSSQETLVN